MTIITHSKLAGLNWDESCSKKSELIPDMERQYAGSKEKELSSIDAEGRDISRLAFEHYRNPVFDI